MFCCFGCVSKKVCGCWFLALLEAAAAIKIRDQIGHNWFPVGFQKGLFGFRATRYCDCFCVIFGRKLSDVLLFRLCFEKGVWLLVSCFIRGRSSNQNWRSKLDKIGFLVRFQKAPGNLLLRLILRQFRHEIRWCFAVLAVFQKRCLAAAFLLIYRQQQQSKLEIKIGQSWISNRISEGAFRPPGDLLLRLMFSSILARNSVVFCCFGCVSKKVSGCWFLALLEAAAAVKIGDQNWTKLDFE